MQCKSSVLRAGVDISVHKSRLVFARKEEKVNREKRSKEIVISKKTADRRQKKAAMRSDALHLARRRAVAFSTACVEHSKMP
jgi:hypothetical protein